MCLHVAPISTDSSFLRVAQSNRMIKERFANEKNGKSKKCLKAVFATISNHHLSTEHKPNNYD